MSQTSDPGSLFLVGQDITEFTIAPKNAQYIKHLDLSYNLLQKVIFWLVM